jgi:hypothetical protein
MSSSVVKDLSPVILYADEGDAVCRGIVERVCERTKAEIAVISDLALRIVMVDEQRQACAGTRFGVAQHGEITVGIAESEDGPASDMQTDIGWLCLTVIE